MEFFKVRKKKEIFDILQQDKNQSLLDLITKINSPMRVSHFNTYVIMAYGESYNLKTFFQF